MERLTDAADSGNEYEMLVCLRKKIATAIDESADGREISSLSRQFVDVSERIAEIEKAMPKKNRNTALDKARSKRHGR